MNQAFLPILLRGVRRVDVVGCLPNRKRDVTKLDGGSGAQGTRYESKRGTFESSLHTKPKSGPFLIQSRKHLRPSLHEAPLFSHLHLQDANHAQTHHITSVRHC
ncbi:hypothetical protein ACN47E_008324 [Coniothyrium glycines]